MSSRRTAGTTEKAAPRVVRHQAPLPGLRGVGHQGRTLYPYAGVLYPYLYPYGPDSCRKRHGVPERVREGI